MVNEPQEQHFLSACKFVADNPYLNVENAPRRIAALSELLGKSSLVHENKLTPADLEISDYFSGKSISTKAAINSYIRINLNKDINPYPEFIQANAEASFYICNANWRITGFKRILEDTRDRFELKKVEVIGQKDIFNSDVERKQIKVSPSNYMLTLDNLESSVKKGESYYFLFTLKDLITQQNSTFAYPIDFKAD